MSNQLNVARRPGGRSAKVLKQVTDATLTLLLDKGIEGTTIPEIAKISGVSHVSIYRKWKDRETLISETVFNEVDLAVKLPDTGNFKDDLTIILTDMIALHKTPLGGVLLDLISTMDKTFQEIRRTVWKTRRDYFLTVVKNAIDRGEIDKDTDHRIILELLIGPLVIHRLNGDHSFEEFDVEKIIDMVLNGIKYNKH